jgi:hypothetical protein
MCGICLGCGGRRRDGRLGRDIYPGRDYDAVRLYLRLLYRAHGDCTREQLTMIFVVVFTIALQNRDSKAAAD